MDPTTDASQRQDIPMTQWYLARGGQQSGPYSQEALRQLVVSEKVSPQETVWSEGMASWMPIRSVPELAIVPAGSVAPGTSVGAVAAPAPPVVSHSAPVEPSGVRVTQGALRTLRSTRQWAQIISLILLIGAGLEVVVVVLALAKADPDQRNAGYGPAAIAIVLAIIYGIVAVLLSSFGGALRKVFREPTDANLEQALRSQNAYWAFMGVLTLLAALGAVVLMGLMFVNGGRSPFH